MSRALRVEGLRGVGISDLGLRFRIFLRAFFKKEALFLGFRI